MIQFSQYIRGRGREPSISVQCGPELEAIADSLSRAGYSFNSAIGADGRIVLTVEDEDVVIAREAVWGYAIHDGTARLIRSAEAAAR